MEISDDATWRLKEALESAHGCPECLGLGSACPTSTSGCGINLTYTTWMNDEPNAIAFAYYKIVLNKKCMQINEHACKRAWS